MNKTTTNKGPVKYTGDPAKGERLYRALCATCHAPLSHSIGPALRGIAGTNIAIQSGYDYSSDLASKARMKWTDDNLHKFLKAPKEFAPNTAMNVAGVTNMKDRTDIICFLKGGRT